MNLLGTPKEKRRQFYFRSDDRFTIRELDLEDGDLCYKMGNNVDRAWPDIRRLHSRFPGYKGIPGGMLHVGFDTDIILDTFGVLKDDEKPVKGPDLAKDWIAKKAESRRYKTANKPQGMFLAEKITMFLGFGFLLLVVAIVMNAVRQ